MKPNILMPIMNFMTRYYHSIHHINRITSAPLRIFKTLSLSLVTLVTLFLYSCEEDPITIGKSLLPNSDFINIHSIDTLSVFSYTDFVDSVSSENPSVSYMGSIYDPYFGTTKAGFVSEIRMTSEWDDLPFIIDSVRLYLKILTATSTGADKPQTLRLSEIADRIYPDQTYYSNRPLALTGYEIAGINIPVLRTDTVNNIVLNLPNSFGEYLTRDTAMLFYSNTKPDFRSFFKGLYFQMNAGETPMLISLSLTNESISYYNNELYIYMHTPGTTTSKVFTFALDAVNKNAAYNTYSHDFNTAEPDKKIKHINDNFLDTLSYLQYLNGVFTRIEIPGLKDLKDNPSYDNIAVNKARLTLPAYFDGDNYTPSKAPVKLLLRYKTASGNKYIVPDWNVESNYHIFYNGTLDTTAHHYNINIPTFIQNYLDDKQDTIFPVLEVFQGAGTSNLILKTKLSKTPVKLDLTYTKF